MACPLVKKSDGTFPTEKISSLYKPGFRDRLLYQSHGNKQ